MRRLVLVLLGAAVLASDAWAVAHVIRGRVQQTGGASPVAGAVVSITDSAGRASARTISDEHGQYIVAWAPTATRLRVIRIGLRPISIDLPPGSPHDVS